ncbi:EamA family transporter, partial [Candidatus Gracilibacteria bacterium]|nr:EamA family transporter [Candidatus Gracilibacteria bacterium]
PVAIGSAFSLTTRILVTIILGILLAGDTLNSNQIIGTITLLGGIFLLLNLREKFKPTGILLSIILGTIFVINWYSFTLYSPSFHPIMAGYILEIFNGLFLLFILLGKSLGKNNSLSHTFHINKKPFWIIFATAPLVIIASGSVAKAYEVFSFTIVGIALTMTIPVSMILSWLILKEKLSIKSVASIIIITLSIVAIKFFEA